MERVTIELFSKFAGKTRDVLSNGWTAVVAAEAVKECLLYWEEVEVVVCDSETGGGAVYHHPHRSPSCLPVTIKLETSS